MLIARALYLSLGSGRVWPVTRQCDYLVPVCTPVQVSLPVALSGPATGPRQCWSRCSTGVQRGRYADLTCLKVPCHPRAGMDPPAPGDTEGPQVLPCPGARPY